MRKIKSIVLGIILLFLAIFLVQNLKIISINFLFWGSNLPGAILVGVVFVAGILFGAITFSFIRHRNRNL